MKIKLCILIFFFLYPYALKAQRNPNKNYLIIKDIIIFGNTKTKTDVIKGIIRTEAGDPFTKEIPKKIKRYLDNQRKFSEVAVTYKKEGGFITLYIYVKDKWSLILAPYYYYSNNNSSIGFIFMESNLFGTQNIILFTFIYEYETINGKVMFSHPRVLNSLFSYVVMADRFYQPIYDYNKDKTVNTFYRDDNGIYVNAKYQFYGEHYFMLQVFNRKFEDELKDLNDEGWNRFFRVYLELDWLHLKHFLGKGIYLGLYYENDFAKSDVVRSRTGINFETYINHFKLHNLYFDINFFHTLRISKRFEEGIGQDATFYTSPLRGYENGQIKANTALTGTFEYRFPIVELFSVNVIFVPFYDSVIYSPKNGDSFKKFDHSAGVALRFYLKKITIPAIQFYFGYGIKYDQYSIGLMIGARF